MELVKFPRKFCRSEGGTYFMGRFFLLALWLLMQNTGENGGNAITINRKNQLHSLRRYLQK